MSLLFWLPLVAILLLVLGVAWQDWRASEAHRRWLADVDRAERAKGCPDLPCWNWEGMRRRVPK